MAASRGQDKPIQKDPKEVEAIPLVKNNKRPLSKRHLPKNELVPHILDNTTHLKVVSVVGTAGSGKTTLTKMVYDDDNLKRQFQSHAWITISQTSNIESILNDLIQQLDVEIEEMDADQRLKSNGVLGLKLFLKDYLRERRYIIVFDEIQSIKDWKALRSALPDSNCASRVMLTTQSEEVASASCNQHYGYVYKIRQLLSFGPNYYTRDSSEGAKEEAWKQVSENSPKKEETLGIYSSVIKKIEKDAKATYEGGALDRLPESEFRLMMIKDGCFFLQLALFMLGASKQLGYPKNHPFFAEKQENLVDPEWTESMFYVGNQIPLIVLNELMKQTFQNVIKDHGKWKRPTNLLSKMVLYDWLILPAKEYADGKASSTPSKAPAKSANLSDEQPSDLLHALQITLLGPSGSRNDSNEDEQDDDEVDLEAGGTLNSKVDVGNDKDLCVTGCRKKGICFWKSNRVGTRSSSGFGKRGIYFWRTNGFGIRSGIEFNNRILYANLYLPTIPVNRDTEILLKNLKDYEICQQQNEVRSYLGLMNHLISTYEDVHHLASKGIIEIDESKPYYKDMFLTTLRNLSETATNHNHRKVLRQLRDHSTFPWEVFKYGAIIAFILTVLQTVLSVLSYVEGKQQ